MNALKKYMLANNISTHEMAEATKVVDSTISRILTGYSLPDIKLAFAIEDATGGAIEARSWAYMKRKKRR